GRFGTLAVIAEASFKLRALPPCEKTIVFYSHHADSLCSLVTLIADSDIQPTVMELISPYSEAALPINTKHFAPPLGFLTEPETVDSQVKEAARLGSGFTHSLLGEDDANALWKAYHESETSPHTEFILRLSVLPNDLSALIADINRTLPQAHLRAHAANGVVRLHGDALWLNRLKTRERPRKVAEMRRRGAAAGAGAGRADADCTGARRDQISARRLGRSRPGREPDARAERKIRSARPAQSGQVCRGNLTMVIKIPESSLHTELNAEM